jgi:hypothetical protein
LPILQGSNFAFNGFYLFGGGIIPTATRTSDRAQNFKSQTATATSERNATQPTAHFFGSSRRFLGSVVFSAGWNGKRAIQAIFDGLKAPNGSPKAEQGRSDNRKHAERQPFCQPKSPDAPMCEKTVASAERSQI